MTEQTDEQIASRVQGGDVDAFGVLVERYEKKLERYARRFLFDRDDVDDLVQEVFIKAFTNIRGFNSSLRFSPWIYRIAHNQFLNTLRSKKRLAIPFFDPDTLFPHPIAAETADRETLDRELRETLDHSLGKLDAKYREPLILYYYQELDYQEIADILRIPSSTVGVRLARGRAALKTLYEETNTSHDQ